jgi:FkbH-like protein
VKKLKDLNDFNILQRTDEDIKRGEMYSQQRQRNELKESVSNLNDFLQKLDIKVEIKNATDFNIPRISQLTLKTNQFNLTTKRYQENDIRTLANNPKIKIGCAQVQDKFGDNGITSVFIIEKQERKWIIDSFLQSCRVIGRGIEDAIMSEILKDAKKNNIEKVYANFIPTKKNKPTEEFLPQNGFKKENDLWVFDLNDQIISPEHLKINKENV